MARELSHPYASQPSSSQSNGNEASIDRAFWQSTPTALEQLRERTDDARHPARAFSIAFHLSYRRVLKAGSDHVALPDDQNRPEDPLCLSTQQSRLIRQTWTPSLCSPSSTPAGTPCSSSSNLDAETRMSSRSPRHRRRSLARGSSGVGPKNARFAAASVSRPDNSVFRHLKNIEKVCMTVDERIQKKKVHKEWSTKVISDAARLRRDEENSEDVVPGECTHPNRNADRATLDSASPDDRVGTTQSTEVVPTSQSLERYLSLSPLSKTAPTGSPDAPPCMQIDDDREDVAATDSDVMSSLTSLSSWEESQPSQTSQSRVEVADALP